jgi:hypothetical protein
MTAANLVGRVLFLVGSLVFLALSLGRDRPGMALGSALFVTGSLLFLALQVRQLRAERSGSGHTPASEDRRADDESINFDGRRRAE